jgi:hypothetical protein
MMFSVKNMNAIVQSIVPMKTQFKGRRAGASLFEYFPAPNIAFAA